MTDNIQASKTPGSAVPLDVKEDRPICGFWKRVLALFLDGIFLGIAGIVLGLLFGKQFAQMGGWGRLIGFVIALGYFGLLNSRFGKGQSLGKRITRIRVVGWDGECVSLRKSLLRATILELPFFLNGIMLSPSVLMSPIGTIIGLIVFGVGGGVIYFYIFNRRTRQSLHDLVCKTYVVKASVVGPITVSPVARLHYIVFAVFVVCVLAFSTVIAPRLASKGMFPELLTLQKQLYELEKVSFASVFIGKVFGPEGSRYYVSTNVIYKEKPAVFETVAEQVARVILDAYPKSKDKDIINVKVTYGYDIGIARSWRWYSISLSPSEWKERLERKSKE